MNTSTKIRLHLTRQGRIAGVAASLMAVAACAPLSKAMPGSKAIPPSAYSQVEKQIKERNDNVAPAVQTLPAQQRLPVFGMDQDKGAGQPELYSFQAKDLPLRDALALLAKAHGLNIVADPGVNATVSVDFQAVPLARAFDILLSSVGYAWEDDRGVIRVYSSITRTFEVDYIHSNRNSASTAGGDTGTNLNSTNLFWQELESQIRALLTPKGRLTLNRLTGSLMVTDLPSKVAEVERFLTLIREGMYRQVDIEVRIVEVTLRDQFALGLDWSRFRNVGLRSESIGFNNRVTNPQGVTAAPSTLSLRLNKLDEYASLIEAMREQGDVRVVSQPRIRIMNNQVAAVKVGTDETFFARSANRVIQGGGNVLETINEQARTVNLGVSLRVMPQISADGWAMLNIMPSITRLAGTSVSRSGESTAPILDVSEASTMVRVRSGELVILGGLIQEESSDTNRSVPGVGEVPVFGNLFKGTYQSGRRKELVIFLAPTIQPGQ